jgi:hypothetical protein
MSLLSPMPLCFVLDLCGADLPGLAPAGEVLFFASPKQSTQKKGEPGASSLRVAQGTLRCSATAGSAETRPAGSDICASFSAVACATRLRTRRQEPKAQDRRSDLRVPLWLCRGAQAWPETGRRMSEPVGRVCADPGQGEHRRLPRQRRGHRYQGRLFFGDFLLAKQKKVTALSGAHPDRVSPAGARPGKAARPGHSQKEVSQTC